MKKKKYFDLISLLSEKTHIDDWVSSLKTVALKGDTHLLNTLIKSRKDGKEAYKPNSKETKFQLAFRRAFYLAAISDQIEAMKFFIKFNLDENINFDYNPTEYEYPLLFKLATLLAVEPARIQLEAFKNKPINRSAMTESQANRKIINEGQQKNGVHTPVLCCALLVEEEILKTKNMTDFVRLLLEYAANPNVGITHSTFEGCEYPLGLAVKMGDIEIVKLLISYKADVNVLNTWLAKDHVFTGTPLHIASQNNNLEIARVLIEAGAKVSARNSKNQTPLEVAVSEEMKQILM